MPKKIKSSMFSEDGKLKNFQGSSNAAAGNKSQVDAELAALRANTSPKRSIFSEDGKLLTEARTVEPKSNETILMELIEKRLAWLTAKTEMETDPMEKENLDTQIWFLGDQKQQLGNMSPEEQTQMIEMLTAEIEASKANTPDEEKPEPEAAPVEESAKEPEKEPEPEAEPAPEPEPEPAKEPEPEAPEPEAPEPEAPEPAPEPTPPTPETPPKGDMNGHAPTEVTPPPTEEKPAPQSVESEAAAEAAAAPEIVPAASSFEEPATFENTKVERSGSFSNLDHLDDLLLGGELEEPEEEILQWSSDQPHHLSDWRIVVENEQTKVKVTYHVHKLVLSSGPTKSEHFERRFKNHDYGQAQVSGMVLSRSAAIAVPQLLDFMYSRTDDLELNTNNAVGLRHLGKLFGIRKLVVQVTKFIRDDLIPDKGLHYLNAAAEFHDGPVMENASHVCAANILSIDRDGLTSLEPPLFSMVVSCDNVACSSEELSKIVGEFCRKHEEVMTGDLLRVVTAVKNMPVIDRLESVYLLQLSEQHETVPEEKSDLEDRCVLAGSVAWSGTLVGKLKQPPESAGPYDKLSAELKVKLLEDALLKAEEDFGKVMTQKDQSLDKEGARMDEVVEAKEDAMKKLAMRMKEVDAAYVAIKKEIKMFKRVPNDYKFPKNRLGYTYHGTQGKYGKVKPRATPTTPGADHTDAGMIYSEGETAWPMYYFKKV